MMWCTSHQDAARSPAHIQRLPGAVHHDRHHPRITGQHPQIRRMQLRPEIQHPLTDLAQRVRAAVVLPLTGPVLIKVGHHVSQPNRSANAWAGLR
jgi:hypothetical protein